MCHIETETPQEVIEVIQKLSDTDQKTIQTYITQLKEGLKDHCHPTPKTIGQIPDTDAEVENAYAPTVDGEDFPPSYNATSGNNNTEDATSYKIEATDLKSNGDYAAALQKYTLAIQAAPPSALLVANRADCLYKLTRYNAAIQDCNIALEKNADSAKALRIRGRAYKAIGQYENARKDLSTSQTIDYDYTAADELKEVAKKVAEMESVKVKKKVEEEAKTKKRAEDNQKQREEAKKKTEEAPKQANAIPGGMPGGMQGMMGSLFNDPEIAKGMQNPKVREAFSSMMGGGGLDTSKIQECMSDPEVGPIFQKLIKKLGPMMGGMPGGMGSAFGGGMADSVNDDSVPDVDDIPDL